MTDYPRTTGRSLVAFYPCGCWGSVQIEYADLMEQAKESARFLRDNARSGAVRVETMTMDEFRALRNGVNGDLTWGCDHDPKWGGAVSTHAECPRCWKEVPKNKNGTLRSHKQFGFTCSQVPYERPSRESA